FDEATTMGPINNEPNAAKMDRHVADAVDRGAVTVAGGSRAQGFPTNLYWEPTVLDGVTEEMEVAREETFGPVVPISTIRSDDEALHLVNERSEEHTSELQSRGHLVCRLLLEKKKKKYKPNTRPQIRPCQSALRQYPRSLPPA